jgi:NADH-quinone oxidoreductase subunit N
MNTSTAMTALTALLPEHLLLLGMVLLIVLTIAGRGSRVALVLAVASVTAAAAAAAGLSLQGTVAAPFAGHFSVAPAALMGKAVVLALALPVLLMARNEFEGGEFPLLLLSSLYGACLMQSADSFLTLFLGLEILSLPVYVLVMLAYRRPQSAEAALKYLVLGGTATALFLMGVSLLYGSSGVLGIAPAKAMGIETFALALGSGDTMARAAVVLVILSLFLKAAIVPFHAWAPDAYEAASVPVTAYMAVIVKAAVLLAAVRLFGQATLASPMLELVAVLPLVSIVWGNLAAMRQASLRRMVAYSSIAHAGYLYYALLGAPDGRLQATVFYLLAYGLLNLLVFAALPPATDDRERDLLSRLQGLFQRSPFAALMIGIAMLSLAGIPPLPGFIAKFLIFKNVIAAGHTGYAVLGLVGSYLGIYFYLRVIQVMFMSTETAPAQARGAAAAGLNWAAVASAACLAATLAVAVFPGWVLARL